MTTMILPTGADRRRLASDSPIALAAAALCAVLLAAFLRRLLSGGLLLPTAHTIWLTVHLATVLPALPLGAVVLIRRKGDRTHRLLGRLWAVLMMVAAASSFGLHSLTGHLSWIHGLSAFTLAAIPRAVLLAMRGDIVRHRRAMSMVFLALVIAGCFTLLPGRLLGGWLYG